MIIEYVFQDIYVVYELVNHKIIYNGALGVCQYNSIFVYADVILHAHKCIRKIEQISRD